VLFIGFNPRPLLLTGESKVAKRTTHQRSRFQSTPVIANGRIPAGRIDRCAVRAVSIHARYC